VQLVLKIRSALCVSDKRHNTGVDNLAKLHLAGLVGNSLAGCFASIVTPKLDCLNGWLFFVSWLTHP